MIGTAEVWKISRKERTEDLEDVARSAGRRKRMEINT